MRVATGTDRADLEQARTEPCIWTNEEWRTKSYMLRVPPSSRGRCDATSALWRCHRPSQKMHGPWFHKLHEIKKITFVGLRVSTAQGRLRITNTVKCIFLYPRSFCHVQCLPREWQLLLLLLLSFPKIYQLPCDNYEYSNCENSNRGDKLPNFERTRAVYDEDNEGCN